MIDKILKDIEFNEQIESPYSYNNFPVPRVTEILSSMLHEDYLMKWANSIGLYRRKKYEDEIGQAARIGTMTHDYIEYYIKENVMKQADSCPLDERKKIENGLKSFILWYDNLKENNIVEVLGIEQKISCPWFGGTYDMLIKINGKIFLMDFKTSNYVSYKYCLQLAAYKYMLALQGIQIDGTIILQVDKKTVAFEEYVLVFDNPNHLEFINLCTETFLSLVYAYINRLKVQKYYKDIFGGK